jgi:aryl sulfotransferase
VGDAAVERPIECEYRSIISDNLRWQAFASRPGDIFVCTPAKCGTTWMQTIVASLLFPDGDAPGPVVEIAPWIDARFTPLDEVIARLDAQTFRRSVKTHTAADGIPWYPAASYIVVGRDGRDAFMSFLNHMRGLRPDKMGELVTSAIAEGIDLGTDGPPPVDDVHEFFSWWLYKDAHWFRHLSSFWEHRREPNVLFVHYNDMQADLDGQMRRVGDFLGIEVAPEQWPRVVERCTFAAMKARSAEIGDFDRLFVGGADTFLYKASNGRWRDVLTPEELAAFDRRSRELLPPDAIAWTQAGISALDV